MVILVSTSASQEGDYRSKAFEALQAAVAGLGRGDRVRLIATDLNAIPLSKGFVSPQSGEWTAALAALNARTPLGSNDMENGRGRDGQLWRRVEDPRAVVYIGDGSSRAGMLQARRRSGN